MSGRSETVGTATLKIHKNVTTFPDILIEGWLGDAIVVSTDVTSNQL